MFVCCVLEFLVLSWLYALYYLLNLFVTLPVAFHVSEFVTHKCSQMYNTHVSTTTLEAMNVGYFNMLDSEMFQ